MADPFKAPKQFKAQPSHKSAGILDDHAVRKNIATQQGNITGVPTNPKDIVNKEYVDAQFPVTHASTTGQTTDDHHAETHTILSHDTDTTGAELTSLADNSIANTLHRHSELVASDGAPDPALSVDATGKVGIGTTTPGVTFQVGEVGDTNNSMQIMSAREEAITAVGPPATAGVPLKVGGGIASRGNYWDVFQSKDIGAVFRMTPLAVNSGRFDIAWSSTDQAELPLMSLLTGGNVGINEQDPSEKLEVDGNILATGTVQGVTQAEFDDLTDNSMADTLHRHSELSASDGTPDAKLKVEANGNITIGNLLSTVKGDLVINSGNTSTTANLKWTLGNNNEGAAMNIATNKYMFVGDNGGVIGIGHVANLTDTDTAITDRLIINTSGDVGINTASPGSKLQVVGDFRAGDLDTNLTQIGTTGDITQLGTGRTHESEKFKLTGIGGFAIKLTNKTGANSVQGEVVKTSAANDDAVILAVTGELNPIGVFLEGGVADGAEAWIVISGIADVLADTAGFTRGDRLVTSLAAATVGRATANNAPSVAVHFQEIGHAIETAAANTLGRAVIHFL